MWCFFFLEAGNQRGLVRMDDLCHKDILSKEFQAFFFWVAKVAFVGRWVGGKKWETIKTRQKKQRVQNQCSLSLFSVLCFSFTTLDVVELKSKKKSLTQRYIPQKTKVEAGNTNNPRRTSFLGNIHS